MSLDFFIKNHGYETAGFWLPRVTTITSIISKPNLIQYYARHRNIFAAQRALALAADWGTMVHEGIENVLRGESFVIDPRISPSVSAFRVWMREHDIEVVGEHGGIERRVTDLEHRYAGTIDIIAKVDGRVGVIDIKTGSGIWEEYYLQTAAYLHAYQEHEENNLKDATRWILRVDQYQECEGCLAQRRDKDGTQHVKGGKKFCNHQWTPPKADVEWKELEGYEHDAKAFLAAKEVWEWYNKKWLQKISLYPHL
ncbi:MAG: PD-(D/E)XK nuclease family protein [Candidatus Wildermuthbacteria bacterium]|nr:PD-(D/E)XK nuclease family protein [Candidatus Wildermuthbacteria bacterium]